MPTFTLTISTGDLDKLKAVYADEYAEYVVAINEVGETPLSENEYLRLKIRELVKQNYFQRKRKQIIAAVGSADNIDLT